MIINDLKKSGLINPPNFVLTNTQFLALSGSTAYGVSGSVSDWDLVGICIPSKEELFQPGVIPGFGKQKKRFSTWQKHHINYNEKEYDITVYNIVDFFNLCMSANPNLIDIIYTPDNCVLYITSIGSIIRESRHLFLSKLCWPRFKGYAYQMLKKMEGKNPKKGSKRYELIEEFGYDTKYGYHLIRLLNEVEQILATGDLNLQLDKERLKAVRRGEWTIEQIKQFFTDKERDLEALYISSDLPYSPDENKIKALLIQCLELHYDDLSECIVVPGKAEAALRAIKEICDEF